MNSSRIAADLSHLTDGWTPCDRGSLQHPAGSGNSQWSVTHDEGRLLTLLAAGRSVLEFGTGTGLSAAYLALMAREVVTINPERGEHPSARRLWERCGVSERVAQVCSDDEIPGNDRFDLVFIDGLHDWPHVTRDLALGRARLAHEGVIALHDCDESHRDVQQAVAEFTERHRCRVLDTGSAWNVVVLLIEHPW